MYSGWDLFYLRNQQKSSNMAYDQISGVDIGVLVGYFVIVMAVGLFVSITRFY